MSVYELRITKRKWTEYAIKNIPDLPPYFWVVFLSSNYGNMFRTHSGILNDSTEIQDFIIDAFENIKTSNVGLWIEPTSENVNFASGELVVLHQINPIDDAPQKEEILAWLFEGRARSLE